MDHEETLRSHHNEYPGYAAGPMKRTGEMRVRLDFNARIIGDKSGKNRLEGFSLRMMEHPEDVTWPEVRAEFGVSLTVEQWQDLIDAMKAEMEMARQWRDELDALE